MYLMFIKTRFIYLTVFLSLQLIACGGTLTPLMQHAEKGNIAGVKAELAKGQDINEKYFYGTALNYAVMNGQFDTMKVLIKNGAKPRKDNGSYLMFSAMLKIGSSDPFTDNHLNIVKYLVDNGGNIQADPYSAPTVSLLGRITESFCNLYASDEVSNSKALYAIAYIVAKGATYRRSFNHYKNRACTHTVNSEKFEMVIRNAPAYLAKINAQDKADKETKVALSAVQQLLKKQHCSLNTRDWIYIDNKCRGRKAHGIGRAVYKDGKHFFKGEINKGRLVLGEYLENGKTIYEGKFVNNRPHGAGICFYKNKPEECRYYKGERVDSLYKQRQENAEFQRKQKEELAKLRG